MRTDCDDIRDLTAEVALGIASGDDRARVLEHAAGCRACRDELRQLTTVTDELLVLAPELEPPPGFEQRVLRELAPAKKPKTLSARLPRLLKPALALAAGAAIASVVSVAAFHDDHQLASEYRQALAAADGSRFVAIPLRDGAGVKRGSVSLYKGAPSWIVITANGASGRSLSRAELVSRSGKRVALTDFALRGGVWGGPLPIGFDSIASVQVMSPDGHSQLVGFANRHW
jgi:Putative zinc-finger